MSNVHDGRRGRSPRARLRLREARFLLTKIRLVLQFLSVQTKKIHYIKKVTMPHVANTNVCRYSQFSAPKTPTTQTAVKLPMSSAVFLVNRKWPARLIP